MIRVLFVIDGLRGGGKERQLIEIIKYLYQNKNIKLGIITFNKNEHYSNIILKYLSFFAELNKRPTRLEPLFTIWKQIINFKPNIVHTWDSLSSFYSYIPCKLLNIKLIDGSIRDAGIERGWEYLFKRFYLKRSDAIVANSFAGLRCYKVNGSVVYNAINFLRFKEQEKNDLFNIVMTANFTDYKDHKTFINVAVKLVKINVVDYVYLIGEGKNKNYYQNYVPKDILERFIFTGAVTNVEEYLAKCKIGVLCSTLRFKEGISNSVLEYMGAGLISISTDTGGTKEIIEDGINGFLVKTEDEKSLYEKIVYIKNNYHLLNNIIENAKQTVIGKFNYIKNTNILTSLYINLLKVN